ncbi:MAG TPA: hypothetical protein DCS67_10185 [Clostridiales bacterium UBA8960]|nr:hypothetical protein [Clostridiales bacterium UBA8960]
MNEKGSTQTAPAATKHASKSRVMYALSIHMKYGEVLHIEGLNKEEKDRYFELARNEQGTMLVEDKTSVVHLLSKDIAKISVKAYDEKYERIYHPLEKLFFSESSFGRKIFSLIIKSFVILAILSVIGVLGLTVIDGTVMDVLFDGEMLLENISKGLSLAGKFFSLTVALMLVLNVVDIALGYKAHYYINQDGSEPVEYSRLSNLFVTIAFIIVYSIAKMVLGQISGML